MKVERIPNQFNDLMAVNCARVSFNKWHESFVEGKDDRLINYLVRHNHWTPLAQGMTTVRAHAATLPYRKMVQHKCLMAGLNMFEDGDYMYITSNAWGLLNLAAYLDDYSLRGIVKKHCPHIEAAFDSPMMALQEEFEEAITPIHHQPFTFRITMPIAIRSQFVKHQVGLVVNEVSRRYVDTPPEFHYPSEWRGKAADKKQGSSEELVEELHSMLYEEVMALCKDWYMFNDHICPEQRRFVLPQSMMTTIIVSGTREAFERIIWLRNKPDAQKEIQWIAQQIEKGMSDDYDQA